MRLSRPVANALWAVSAVIFWATLVRLMFVENAGSGGALSARGALTCVFLIAAPVATFVPLARVMKAPLYDVEGVLGWAIFGFMLTFIRPADPPTLTQFLLFLLPLTVALASVATPVSWLAGLRIWRGDPRQWDIARARRQGYLAAFFIVALVLLRGVGTLTPATGALLLLIVALVEMFALGRDDNRVRTRPARGPGW